MAHQNFGFEPEIEAELNNLFSNYVPHRINQHVSETDDIRQLENTLLNALQHKVPGLLVTPFFTFNLEVLAITLLTIFLASFSFCTTLLGPTL